MGAVLDRCCDLIVNKYFFCLLSASVAFEHSVQGVFCSVTAVHNFLSGY